MEQAGFQVAKDQPLEILDDDGCEATRQKLLRVMALEFFGTGIMVTILKHGGWVLGDNHCLG